MIKSFLASRMRSLRKARHLTQGDVASQLHIERQTYCNYENSTRTPPLETVISLAEFYQVTVDYLVREDGADGDPLQYPYRPLTNAEETFLNSFRSLPSQSQKEVLQFIHFKSIYS